MRFGFVGVWEMVIILVVVFVLLFAVRIFRGRNRKCRSDD